MTGRVIPAPVFVYLTITVVSILVVMAACNEAKEDLPETTRTSTVATTPSDGLSATPTWSTNVPTEWLTYTDPILLLSFSYPADLTVWDDSPNESPKASSQTHVPVRALTLRGPEGDPLAVVSAYSNTAYLTPIEWAREFTACHFDDPYEVKTVEINGASGITCVAEAVEGILERTAVISHGGMIIHIGALMNEADFGVFLSSFRFAP